MGYKKGMFVLVCLLINIATMAQVDTTEQRVPGRKNSLEQQKKPYVILISADGFRWDYAAKYNAKNLLRYSKKGVRASSMIPSFPSLTFPNHYATITGMYPAHNGLVGNTFYDATTSSIYNMNDKKKAAEPGWYGGTPLWVLAEKQQLLTASFYWVASDVAIQGVRPTYYFNYNEKIGINERVQTVVNWLRLPEEQRPHFITFYFPEVDHEGHDFGPDAGETKTAVRLVDSYIRKLVDAVAKTGLPVNYFFTSDHGMTTVDTTHFLTLPTQLDTAKFRIPTSGNLLMLYAKNNTDVLPAYHVLKQSQWQYTTYLKDSMPAHTHYATTDDRYNRIADIIVATDAPKVFNLRKRSLDIGMHGYDPYKLKDMHASFYAWGPAIKKRMHIPSFENVHIYPMIARLLGLPIKHDIDGKLEVLEPILK